MKFIFIFGLLLLFSGYFAGAANLVRGPYLQLGTSNSIIIRWRTDAATDSKVNYGLSYGNLNLSVSSNSQTTEHEIQLNNLSPYTKYYYSIGSASQILQDDSSNYFYTSPTAGTPIKTRIWVTGDCGTGNSTQAAVRDKYLNFIGNNYTNLWLLLGDNAYNVGSDSEYQANFFSPYMIKKIMKQTVLWPAPGNHDYYNTSNLESRSTPYFNNFTVPVNAEAGGIASGTESYYSYNYANIHFVSLDSYGTENSKKLYDTTSTQITWLKQDLANNTQAWTIVYWHHPPYTKGSHNCDTESELVNIRKKVIKILERYKVDLVLCGHSHAYERSRLIKGHYGLESTFVDSIHNISSSSALYDGSTNSCPYIKSTESAVNEGVVYVVAGSAGKLGGITTGWPHNAMYYSTDTVGGSLYLEVNNNRLDAKFITETGAINDQFTIMKDVNNVTDTTIAMGENLILTASWPGSYLWNNNNQTDISISINPTSDAQLIVTDGTYNCLADTFNITVNPSTNKTIPDKSVLTGLFPNPNGGNFYFSVSKTGLYEIEIYGLDGKLVFRKSVQVNESAKNNFVESKLPAGSYFVKAKSEAYSDVSKLIISEY